MVLQFCLLAAEQNENEDGLIAWVVSVLKNFGPSDREQFKRAFEHVLSHRYDDELDTKIRAVVLTLCAPQGLNIAADQLDRQAYPALYQALQGP